MGVARARRYRYVGLTGGRADGHSQSRHRSRLDGADVRFGATRLEPVVQCFAHAQVSVGGGVLLLLIFAVVVMVVAQTRRRRRPTVTGALLGAGTILRRTGRVDVLLLVLSTAKIINKPNSL